MTANEIRLIELLASAAKGSIMMAAGALRDKGYTDECWRQCAQIDEALQSVKNPPPVQSVQHADTDPHEKDESRAGIRPFERNAVLPDDDEVL
jgi:hypothetical protein